MVGARRADPDRIRRRSGRAEGRAGAARAFHGRAFTQNGHLSMATKRKAARKPAAHRKPARARSRAGSVSVFEKLAVKPVINCCGIYTDLGGSVLSGPIWAAATELNQWFVRMTDLLDSTGEIIAKIAGAEAARVTPGA